MKTKSKLLTTLAVSATLCVGFAVGNVLTETAYADETNKIVLCAMNSDYTTSASTLNDINGMIADGTTDLWAGIGIAERTNYSSWTYSNTAVSEDRATGYISGLGPNMFTFSDTVTFNTAVPVSEIDTITFRIYVGLGFDGEYNFAENGYAGIRLYGVGATGASGEGYKIPVGSFTIGEMAEITVPSNRVAQLADANGNFSGFQVGSLFFGDVASYAAMHVDTISYTVKTGEEEDDVTPNVEVLTNMNNDYTTSATTLTDVNSFLTDGIADMWGGIAERQTTLSWTTSHTDLSEDLSTAYVMGLGSNIFAFSDTVHFKKSIPVNQIETITFRIYVGLGFDGTYNFSESHYAGIRLYGVGATGLKSEGYKIPVGTFTMGEMVEITIPNTQVEKLADANGNFSGFQVGSLFFGDVSSWSAMHVDTVSCVLKTLDEGDVAVNTAMDAMEMTAGAAIRLSEAGNGIRFETNVDKAVADEFMASNLFEEVAFGTLIVPVDYLTEGETLESLRVAGKVAMLEARGFYAAQSDETTYRYWGSLVDIKDYNYYREFIGVGYIKTVDADGVESYTYMRYDLANARSVYEVAVEAYKSDIEWTTEELALIKAYIDAVVIINGTTGAYAGGLEGYVAPYEFALSPDGEVAVNSSVVIKTVVLVKSGRAKVVPSNELKFSEDGKSVTIVEA